MALKTRKPTGATSWPLILLAGEAKTGKTYSAAEFTGDERVGRSFWLDLGEGCADEYGQVPGADYEIIEHDGTWIDIIEQVEAVRDVAREELAKGNKPVSLTIDSMTAEWAMLTLWTDTRARRSTNNRKLLAENPDAEIDVTSNYWNDANSRHNRLMNILKTFPGIVIMTSLETEKTQFDAGGRPMRNAPKVARPDAQKRLHADASVWVRLSLDNEPTIVGIRSVKMSIRPGKDQPKTWADFTLGKLVFDFLEVHKDVQARNVPALNADQLAPEEDPQHDQKIAAAKAVVADLAKELKWDADGYRKLLESFAADNDGKPLSGATLKELEAFADSLRLVLAQPVEEPA
jgi:AAA domain